MVRSGAQLLVALALCAPAAADLGQGLRGSVRAEPGAMLDSRDSDAAEEASGTAANTTRAPALTTTTGGDAEEGLSPWVVEGPCRVSEDDTDCVESPNFPKNYGNGQSCVATLIGHKTRYLDLLRYDVEVQYDDVHVDQQGPLAISREPQTITGGLMWSSDDSTVGGGWKICARALPVTTETSGPWVVFGPCEVGGPGRDCVTSPHFPEDYGNNELCYMAVRSDVTRYADLSPLDIVAPHDFLVMSPNWEAVATGRELDDVVLWKSDKSETAGGWKLCAASEPPASGGDGPGGDGPAGGDDGPAGGVWSVTGPCTIDEADAECVTSSSYPGDYGNTETCTMALLTDERRYLAVDSYDVEEGYDFLSIGGVRYDPTFAGVAITEEITWSSDESVAKSGWRICARRTITTMTTTTRTFQPGSWFIDGPCESLVEDGKQCVTSPNFPEDYANNQKCSLSVYGGGTKYLEVAYLDEAAGYRADSLMMGEDEITHHASGQAITEITWASDGLTSVGGSWKLCALEAPKQEAGTWEWTGPCELDPADSECITSPHFPGAYGEGDLRCSMWIYGGETRYLEIVRMEMETGFPPLFMGGKPLFANRENEAIHPVLSWSAATTGSESVWKVCARKDF